MQKIFKYIAPIVLSVTLGLFAGLKSYNHEKARGAKIPLGFSEISQIERDAMYGEKIYGQDGEANKDAMERALYLCSLNDLTMKIFECWNSANSQKGEVYNNFSNELTARIDSGRKKFHYNLADLFEIVPMKAELVKKQLNHFQAIREKTPVIASDFYNSWSEKHDDSYHTETSVSFDGNNVSIQTTSVYDYTDHYYWYHPEYGERASQNLDYLIETVDRIELPGTIFTASKTNVSGREAAIESRKIGRKPKDLSDEDLKQIADSWLNGSTFQINELIIYQTWPLVVNGANVWGVAKQNAQDKSYRTYSSSDSGPEEYQVARSVSSNSRVLADSSNNLIGSIEFTEQQLPFLRQKIDYFISDKSEPNERSGRDILETTKSLYKANFPKGFDVNGFRGGRVALWTLLGMAVGIGAGIPISIGADRLLSRKEDDFYFR